MVINIIVATDKNGLFSSDGKIPWRDTTDLKRFKELTAGDVVIMGRKTFESLPGTLPGRIVGVISSRNELLYMRDRLVFNHTNLQTSLAYFTSGGIETSWICGGQEVYNEALGFADSIYRTVVNGDYYPGEDSRYFHVLKAGWKLVSSAPYENGVFEIYDRVGP